MWYIFTEMMCYKFNSQKCLLIGISARSSVTHVTEAYRRLHYSVDGSSKWQALDDYEYI